MRWRTYSPQFRNIEVPVPSFTEQIQIVRFLDWKVSGINKLINIKKKEITELDELKKVTISKAVTKGLNGNVKMKKCNIDFTECVPIHWECLRLKTCCRILNGSDPCLEGDIPVYGSGSEIVKFCGEFKEGPAILLGRKGTLNKPKIIFGKFWNVDTAMDLHVKDSMDIKYMFYVATLFDIDKYSTCTTKPSMTQTDYYNIQIPAPPKYEQEEIANYIDFKTEKIDSLIEAKHNEIQTLRELKNRLIFDAVTGQIDVRNIEIPDYDFIDETTDVNSELKDEQEYDEEQED